jgi:Tfp pilus assembly protein PilP
MIRALRLLGFLAGGLASGMAGAATPPTSVDQAEAEKMELLNLRDPFKRPDLEIQGGTPKSPLEMISIDQVKLTGVITGPHRFKAMLQVGDKTYFVSEKAKVGSRKGYVAKITQNSIRVRERIVNLLGKEEDVETELKLASDAKAAPENPGPGR